MIRLGHIERVLVECLQDQPLDTSDLAHAVGRPTYQVYACLRRLRARGIVDQLGAPRPKLRRLGTNAACWRVRARREPTPSNPDRDLDVLQALDRRGEATAAELVRESGWGRTDVYRALRSLEDRELVQQVESTERARCGTRAARWRVAA
jgi:DNA-binding IclR family transcriptional regulator